MGGAFTEGGVQRVSMISNRSEIDDGLAYNEEQQSSAVDDDDDDDEPVARVVEQMILRNDMNSLSEQM